MEGKQTDQNDPWLPICHIPRGRDRCYHSSVSTTGQFVLLICGLLLTSTRLLPGP